MEHYRNPCNKGVIKNADFTFGVNNPSCGDHIIISGHVKGGEVVRLAFDGTGCVISQATASLLTQEMLNQPIAKIMKFDKNFVLDMISMPLGPIRLKCALISLEALQNGLEQYKDG